MKLHLFDCDGTLWKSDDNDYIGSVVSPLTSVGEGVVKRELDGKIFRLFEGVKKMFSEIKSSNDMIGIVSDNPREMVFDALKCFNLMDFISEDAINVRLWKGYCPKHIMVQEILKKKRFSSVSPESVIWYDDKDYTKEAESIGVKFVRVLLTSGVSTNTGG